MLVREKHTSVLNQFINIKENELLLIWYQGLYSKHSIFFVT